MVFHPPPWVPKLPIDPPDFVTIADFMKSHGNGGRTLSERRNPYTCGLTGRSYSWAEVFERVEFIARALSKRTGWAPNAGTPWDKVGCVFSLNSVDYIPTVYAIHRLSGIVTPANAVYSVAELEHQLKSSGSQILITCVPLLDTALQAAKKAGIANDKIFILPMAGAETSHQFPSIEDLIKEGKALPDLEALKWTKGQGARQPAMLSYSSGTSGLPKAVMVSHRNVIANVIQQTTFEEVARSQKGIKTQVLLGLLPLSHIYGLIVVAHSSTWRGDEVIILPKFELETLLAAIQKHKIEQLLVVPPIVIRILRSQDICRKYDMSSVRFLYTGAAPMGKETIEALEKQYPKWVIGQAYGMTETATVVVTTSEHDILHKSSGSLVPGTRAKLVDLDGSEITEYDKPGELLVQSPSVTLGYHNNEKATAETFIYDDDGRWIRTGDEVLVTLAPSGNEHFVVVDRIKELIKVKGHQVAPAELEAHLLTHPAVSDCTVIQVPDDHAGEVPKAFVVKAAEFESKPEEEVAQAIIKHVADHKASYKHLKGGVEFIDVIPKSPSGKILRRFLRDKEREKRRKEGGKL